MGFFKVTVTKTTDYYVGVEAEDVEEARQLAEEADLDDADEATELGITIEVGDVEAVEAVKTVEGTYLEAYDRFWKLGSRNDGNGWEYVPFALTYPADADHIGNADEVFSTYEAAQQYADKRNGLLTTC